VREGFAGDPALLPTLSFDATPPAWIAPGWDPQRAAGLYAIVDSAARVREALSAGVETVQLRIKDAEAPSLRDQVRASVAACRKFRARLFVNDHWIVAMEERAHGVHLGQADLAALGHGGRRALSDSGLALGVSSHSLWELARAKALAPEYIACGPVWPTITKQMPWNPQGLDNLAWWSATAGVPVAAIGGILTTEQVRGAASCGAQYVCVVRALGAKMEQTVPSLKAALRAGCSDTPIVPPALPHPTIGSLSKRSGPGSF
jgi:thiamine-phosphate diphosphorylase